MDINRNQKAPEQKSLLFLKKRYAAPELVPQKHLRDITLGPSEGSGESGNANNYKPSTDDFPLGDGKDSSAGGGDIWENDIFGE